MSSSSSASSSALPLPSSWSSSSYTSRYPPPPASSVREAPPEAGAVSEAEWTEDRVEYGTLIEEEEREREEVGEEERCRYEPAAGREAYRFKESYGSTGRLEEREEEEEDFEVEQMTAHRVRVSSGDRREEEGAEGGGTFICAGYEGGGREESEGGGMVGPILGVGGGGVTGNDSLDINIEDEEADVGEGDREEEKWESAMVGLDVKEGSSDSSSITVHEVLGLLQSQIRQLQVGAKKAAVVNQQLTARMGMLEAALAAATSPASFPSSRKSYSALAAVSKRRSAPPPSSSSSSFAATAAPSQYLELMLCLQWGGFMSMLKIEDGRDPRNAAAHRLTTPIASSIESIFTGCVIPGFKGGADRIYIAAAKAVAAANAGGSSSSPYPYALTQNVRSTGIHQLSLLVDAGFQVFLVAPFASALLEAAPSASAPPLEGGTFTRVSNTLARRNGSQTFIASGSGESGEGAGGGGGSASAALHVNSPSSSASSLAVQKNQHERGAASSSSSSSSLSSSSSSSGLSFSVSSSSSSSSSSFSEGLAAAPHPSSAALVHELPPRNQVSSSLGASTPTGRGKITLPTVALCLEHGDAGHYSLHKTTRAFARSLQIYFPATNTIKAYFEDLDVPGYIACRETFNVFRTAAGGGRRGASGVASSSSSSSSAFSSSASSSSASSSSTFPFQIEHSGKCARASGPLLKAGFRIYLVAAGEGACTKGTTGVLPLRLSNYLTASAMSAEDQLSDDDQFTVDDMDARNEDDGEKEVEGDEDKQEDDDDDDHENLDDDDDAPGLKAYPIIAASSSSKVIERGAAGHASPRRVAFVLQGSGGGGGSGGSGSGGGGGRGSNSSGSSSGSGAALFQSQSQSKAQLQSKSQQQSQSKVQLQVESKASSFKSAPASALPASFLKKRPSPPRGAHHMPYFLLCLKRGDAFLLRNVHSRQRNGSYRVHSPPLRAVTACFKTVKLPPYADTNDPLFISANEGSTFPPYELILGNTLNFLPSFLDAGFEIFLVDANATEATSSGTAGAPPRISNYLVKRESAQPKSLPHEDRDDDRDEEEEGEGGGGGGRCRSAASRSSPAAAVAATSSSSSFAIISDEYSSETVKASSSFSPSLLSAKAVRAPFLNNTATASAPAEAAVAFPSLLIRLPSTSSAAASAATKSSVAPTEMDASTTSSTAAATTATDTASAASTTAFTAVAEMLTQGASLVPHSGAKRSRWS